MLAVLVAPLSDDGEIVRTTTPADAYGWAISDFAALPANARPFIFYVWIPPWGNPSWRHAATFAINTAASESTVIQHPVEVAGGWLQRWDLRELQPSQDGLKRVSGVIEGLVTSEPFFNTTIDGVTGIAPHIANRHLSAIQALEPPNPLVMRADWMIATFLSAVDGGVYLELKGFTGKDVDKSEEQSPEQEVLARYGIFEDFSERKRGDRRVGMFFSGVTGKPRSVVALRGFAGVGWATEDIFDEDVTSSRHPIYNLVGNEFRGREIIWELPNGLHGVLLTDDKGNILREAPPNIATDSRVPPPHTSRLQAGPISCIRCHASELGLRSCRNDVATMLGGRLEVIGDLTDIGNERDFRDRVAGLYSGRDFQTLLRRGREDYSAAIDEITRGEIEPGDLLDQVTEIYNGYRYELITPTGALRELGIINASDEQSIVLLSQLIGADFSSPVDPAAAAVFEAIPLRRADWNRIYVDMARRAEKLGKDQP